MSDLSFVAGEFTGLAATSREAAEAVRSARPEGGGSAFASAMPGTSLSSQMQGAEEKIADRSMDNAKAIDQAADSLELSERDFIATEEANEQLVGSVMSEQGGASTALGHSYGSAAAGAAGDNARFGNPGGGHSYGGAAAGAAEESARFGNPGGGHSYGGVRSGSSPAGDDLLNGSPGTRDSWVPQPGTPDGRETLEDPNDFPVDTLPVPDDREILEGRNDLPVDLYGGGGGVQAQPYTGGAKVEANPFHKDLGGTVNL